MHQTESHRFHGDNIMAHLDFVGVEYSLHHHIPVFTVAEAQAVSGAIPGAHCRNLFLRDKKEMMYLLTLRDHTPVDLKKLAGVLGVSGRLSFGSPERLWTYLGVKPGSVTPLAILNDTQGRVKLLLERGMLQEPLVNFHPLDNSMTVGMAPSALLKLLELEKIAYVALDMEPLAPEVGHADPQN